MNTDIGATERVTLYYRDGSSDKVYQAAIERAGDLFAVNFAYGRRGTTLATGTKTTTPVDYETAKKIFAKLVSGKKAKGYTEGEDGTPYQHSDRRASGILPQLLNPVEESDLEALLRDNGYCAQEKFDGRRLMVRRLPTHIEGVNKRGVVVGLPETVAREVCKLAGQYVLDGEAVGDDYHVFDLLELNGEDLRGQSYASRMSALRDYDYELAHDGHRHLKCVATAFTHGEKLKLWQKLRRDDREGIVFKRLDAPYIPGSPNRGGPQLKFKFVATLSAIVTKVNALRSVEIGLFKGGSLVPCGNVTVPANHGIPQAEAVVEVRYLYAFRESGILFQPVYLGERDDVEATECAVSQLKYKAED